PIITDTALNHLNRASSQIQAALLERTGEQYDVRDLNDALARWLDSSIESLCEDACELCVTGDRTYASFNRDAFEAQLRQITSINNWDQTAEVLQDLKDQQALALDRAA
ncbi:MAG: hypothetical protein AAF329_12530, partial [Cyanobacteria bacterium P01_A01_bin.17]